jgi:hypothetical protein
VFFCLYEEISDEFDLLFAQTAELDWVPVFLVELVGIDLFLHGLSGASQVYRSSRLAHCKTECSIDKLLDVSPSLNFSGVSTVLTDDLFLVRNILNPVNVLRPAASVLSFDSVWTETGKDEDWCSAARCVVDRGSQALGSDVDVHDNALWFAGQTSVPVGHGQGDHLIWTGDDAWELVGLFLLAFDNGFDDGRVVGA